MKLFVCMVAFFFILGGKVFGQAERVEKKTSLIDWPSVIAAAAGQAADGITTMRAIRNGCVETNSLYGTRYPSIEKMVAIKAGVTAVSVLTSAWMNSVANREDASPKTRKFARVMARSLGYWTGGFGFSTAARNVAACGW